MHAVFAAIGRFDVRFRYLIVAVWVIGGIVGIRLLPNLSAVNNIDNLSEETRKGMTEKAESGVFPHRAPVGYKNDKETRTIVVDPKRAPYVRELFQSVRDRTLQPGPGCAAGGRDPRSGRGAARQARSASADCSSSRARAGAGSEGGNGLSGPAAR
jgi:hypothetical protein